MGAMGRIITGGGEKTRKKGFKMVKQACFGMHDPSAKTQEHDRYSCGDQRVARGVIEGKRGICSANKMYLDKRKTRKQTGRRNTTLKQGHATCHQRYKMQQKRDDSNISKKAAKDH